MTSNPRGYASTVDPSCDSYSLTIAPPATGSYTVEITTTPSSEGDDYDLYSLQPAQPDGRQLDHVGRSREGDAQQSARPARTRVSTLAWLVSAGRHVSGQGDDEHRDGATARRHRRASSTRTTRPPRRRRSRCLSASSRSASLRRAGRGEGARPDPELPAPRRADPARDGISGDQFPLFGAETLVNHGRNYYNNTKPYTGALRVHVEAAVRLCADRVHPGPLQRDEGQLVDR